MPQYCLNHVNGNGNGTVPKKTVAMITTKLGYKKPDTGVFIRYDECCFGQVMSAVPGKAKHITEVVKDCRFYGRPIMITDKKTVLALEAKGLLLFKEEVRKDLLADAHVRDIIYRASQL